MPHRARLLASLVVITFIPVLASSDDGAPTAAKALRSAEAALRDRDWARAGGGLHAVRAQFPAAPEAEEAWALEARALLLAGKARESLDAATEFLKAKGDAGMSAWSGRMKATM